MGQDGAHKKARTLRAFEVLSADYLNDMIQETNFLASASLTCALAGMGTGPQTPEPPLMILVANMSDALASPAYFLATSL